MKLDHNLKSFQIILFIQTLSLILTLWTFLLSPFRDKFSQRASNNYLSSRLVRESSLTIKAMPLNELL